MKATFLTLSALASITLPLTAQTLDFGDLPDIATGTAPGVHFTAGRPDYKTRLADGGPSHPIVSGLNFRNNTASGDAHVDPENDAFQSPNADGDDLAGDNDELGLSLDVTLEQFVADGAYSYFNVEILATAAVTNVLGVPARVFGFIDVNSDGDFDDVDEKADVVIVPGDGSATSANVLFKFKLPNIYASLKPTRHFAMRFRISTDGNLDASGPAVNGEVMDTIFTHEFEVPPGGYALLDYGDLDPARYPVLNAANGARHRITQTTLFLGSTLPDGEVDGFGTIPANGDDANASDDEDSFSPASVLVLAGAPATFPVVASNATANDATLHGFVDWNDDGDFADANEVSSVLVPAGSANATFSLPWNVPSTASTTAPVAVRLRLSYNPVLGPTGIAQEGEVEDFRVRVFDATQLDFGDLPDGPYRSFIASNGAAHVVTPNLFLGSTAPDAEADANATPGAIGDDALGLDDEDAITPPTFFPVRGFSIHLPVKATNNTGAPATLTGFIDWNNDGDFADAEENFSKIVPDGSTGAIFRLRWNVPLTAVHTIPLAARLRLTTDGSVPAFGGASDGEVEDFRVTVREVGYDWADLPDAAPGIAAGTHGTATPPDYRTTNADGGPSHVMRPGLYFENDIVGPTFDEAHLDHENDGIPTVGATGDDTTADSDELGLQLHINRQTIVLDGVHTYAEIELFTSLAVTNTTGSNAFVRGYIDANSDGDFADFGEVAPVIAIPGDDSIPVATPTFTFRISPLTASPMAMTNALRFRISTDTVLGPDGPASDGEVNDAIFNYNVSFSPLPDPNTMMDYGDLNPARYPTLWADNGARHIITPGLFIGSSVDGEADAASGAGATGDDISGTDDEDGFNPASVKALLGFPVKFPVAVTNTGISAATLTGFVDWNDDGDFGDAFETSSTVVPAATVNGLAELSFTVPLTASTVAPLAVRLRLHHGASITPFGHGGQGEVEDYVITAGQGIDFGDLPDTAAGTSPGVVTNLSTISQGDYRTRLADNGARHLMRPDLVLYDDSFGSLVHIDAEADGHPSADADGDNLDGDNDELVALFSIIRQTFDPATTRVTFTMFASIAAKNETGTPAFIHAFMDMNNNGDFTDPGEKAVRDLNGDGDTADAGEAAVLVVPSAPGAAAHTMTFTRTIQLSATNYIPSWTLEMPVRFRLSTASSLGPDGLAPDGEVEDYMVSATFSIADYRPRTIDGATPFDFIVDKNTPALLDAFKVVPPNFISVNSFKWQLGDMQTQGSQLSLSPSALAALGTGLHPYSVNVEFFPGHVGSHTGFIAIRDMADFRTVMDGENATGEDSAPEADLDGDGVSNFTEYALGTDPGTAGDATKLLVFTAPNLGGGTDFTLTYLRRIGGTEIGARYETPLIIYQLQSSDELTDWSKPLNHIAPPPALPTPPAGYEWGAVRRTVPGEKAFGRIGVFAR